MQVPLIIRAPWITSSVGFRTGAMAELVDLYPTAVALSGLPAVPASEGLEGTSLLPVMEQPTDELAHNKSCASPPHTPSHVTPPLLPHTPFLRACVRACSLLSSPHRCLLTIPEVPRVLYVHRRRTVRVPGDPEAEHFPHGLLCPRCRHALYRVASLETKLRGRLESWGAGGARALRSYR